MDLFALTRALVDIDSTTGREPAATEFLAGYLEPLTRGDGGGVLERWPVEGARENLFAAWGEPMVVLSTHLDTVPPFFPSSEDGERIGGRGSCDAKGIAAAMVKAVEGLLAEGGRGFGLLFVVGEETDSVGAIAANRTPRGSRFLIDGEPTENRQVVGHRGALWLALEAAGRAAHSSTPELGDSAIERLLDGLAALRALPLPEDPLLGQTLLNVGTIAGGRAPNVVADEARAEVMVRTVGDTTEWKRALREALGPSGVRVADEREIPPVVMRPLPGFATEVVRFTTDIPRLAAWGEPFLLGPGSVRLAHTAEEHVEKRELVEAVGLYRRMVRLLLEE
ncbi:MAG TPA: M20/M25/M40 family metallo-hydrolase [Thermoanaerobaculia bacterium]|nr:M20/M25/M40 family metallo-hydrolase [Thermoanaerobaculia bacterium]